MDDRLLRVEAAVRELEQTIGTIERRLAVIERAGAETVVTAPPDLPALSDLPGPPALPVLARDDLVATLSFVGRTFVALGGAYLLRALTDAAVVPVPRGIALGLAYAMGWLVMSDRAAAANRRTSAAFHGLVATIIAFPLVWESVTRFQLLTPNAAASALVIVTALMLAAALRQRSQALAWMAVVAALATSLALEAATRVVLPFAGVTVALAIGTLWLGYSADWVLLRWPAAFVADMMVLALAARAASGSWPDPPAGVIALQLLLLTGHLASVAARTLLRGRDVNAFEVLQTAAALIVGFGGAVYVARATGFGATALAAMNLCVGAGAYGVAFAFLARQQALRRNFYFYTSLGLILVVVSMALLLSGAMLPLAWLAVALLTTVLARRTDRITLAYHSTVYVLAAAIASGLLTAAGAALVGGAAALWPPMSGAALAVLFGAAACWAIPGPPTAGASVHGRVPRLTITILLVWSAAGWLIGLIAPLLPATSGHADPGVLATVRTSVLAAAALALAWAGRSERFRESSWLLYPLLALGGLKLLVEDLPRSRPATLFIALALYGGALIVAPRLGRRGATQKSPER
ncbi:MAG TPA: hypothetical protein VKI43_02075 [Vicinamibacterales bacterium]|nr:hypothetical protein [Vicinamibacterales bacterium]